MKQFLFRNGWLIAALLSIVSIVGLAGTFRFMQRASQLSAQVEELQSRMRECGTTEPKIRAGSVERACPSSPAGPSTSDRLRKAETAPKDIHNSAIESPSSLHSAPSVKPALPVASQKDVLDAIFSTDDQNVWGALDRLGIRLTSQDYLRLLSAIPDDFRRLGEINRLLPKWLEIDPIAAAAWVRSLPEGPRRNHAISCLCVPWLRRDFAAASEWIVGLPDGPTRDNAIRILCVDVMIKDAPAAIEWSSRMSDGNQRDSLIPAIVSNWAAQDSAAAERWVQKMPAGNYRDMA